MSSTLTAPATAHSAQVHMRLVVEGVDLPIAQLGPDFLILETPTDLRVGKAEIILQVDASERRWTVALPDGLSAAAQRTRIAKR